MEEFPARVFVSRRQTVNYTLPYLLRLGLLYTRYDLLVHDIIELVSMSALDRPLRHL